MEATLDLQIEREQMLSFLDSPVPDRQKTDALHVCLYLFDLYDKSYSGAWLRFRETGLRLTPETRIAAAM